MSTSFHCQLVKQKIINNNKLIFCIGIHQYKFVVDGKWVHAQDQPISTDIKGNVNNFVDVKPVNRADSVYGSPNTAGIDLVWFVSWCLAFCVNSW